MPHFHPLTVTDMTSTTRDAVVVTLAPRAEDAEVFRFTQGQYLTLRQVINGEEVRRSYSICASINEPLRVGIKRVKDGIFSNWVADHLKPGNVIESMTPAGGFFTPLYPDQSKHYLAIVGGSGITPVLGIIKTTLVVEPASTFTLFYGNMASGTIMFREELEDLKNRYIDRLQIVHILDREHQDIELFNGILDQQKCTELLKHWVHPGYVDQAFICGPEAMMLAAAEALKSSGIDKHNIKFELFASPGRRRTTTADQSDDANAESEITKSVNHDDHDTCNVTLVIDGRRRELSVIKGHESILDAGLNAGIELPFACKGGVCSTCRALLKSGEVDMDANFSLEDYEVERGYILTCQSFPVTDSVVVDYDE
ncbi:MAG: phenylacetic acid degradation protein [marine bacterium B5-7]|nr:MAG: phenylacetic acid degradation protein [marine bacterium B5-7]